MQDSSLKDAATPMSESAPAAPVAAAAPMLAPVVIRQDFTDGLRLDLNLGVAAYPVFLMEKPAQLLARYMETLIGQQTAERQSLRLNDPKRVILLCDENTAELFGIDIETQFITAGWEVDALTVPAGEQAKTLAVVEQLCEALAALGANRNTVLCSLGGGIMSDLAGFVAGIFKRGMHLAHISTSLVGLVDAAVGGKTAVNLPTGKNQIGLYKHPLAIVSDPSYLQQLPEEDYVCGLAEAAKTALLAGGEFTAWIEDNTEPLLQRDPVVLRELIARCISFKASIVATDPHEDNVPSARLSLNYGHTLGHVIETVTAQQEVPVPHGIAVAQGMRFEARMAMQLVEAEADFVLRQDALLDALNLPALDPVTMGDDFDHIVDIFYRDKKIDNSELRFILMATPGHPEIVTVPREILCDHLRAWLPEHSDSANKEEVAVNGAEGQDAQ
ncbi:MAG: 3-dehydroquinate synthase [Coriobacteriia bacterium]|nr:3-dehydroquinate synthase [Coriobacteriia bacterium]MCL2871262.1 3-dehydroquinate synthase [Coriobacteriia bacterium]